MPSTTETEVQVCDRHGHVLSCTVHFRFFAAAKAAAGTSQLTMATTDGITLGELLNEAGFGDNVAFTRSSFLVNERSAERIAVLKDGDRVDVLPPFAGG